MVMLEPVMTRKEKVQAIGRENRVNQIMAATRSYRTVHHDSPIDVHTIKLQKARSAEHKATFILWLRKRLHKPVKGKHHFCYKDRRGEVAG